MEGREGGGYPEDGEGIIPMGGCINIPADTKGVGPSPRRIRRRFPGRKRTKMGRRV